MRRCVAVALWLVALGLTLFAADAAAEDTLEASSVLTSSAGEPGECTFDECCYPRWSARAGAIFLQRSTPGSSDFIYNANTGDSVINPNGFVFPYQAGADVGLLRYGECYDFDIRYFGINNSVATQGPIDEPPGVALALPGLGGGGSPDPLRVTSTYKTSLNSVEFNVRKRVWPNVSLLAGFRYLSFDERMSAEGTIIPAGPSSGVSIGSSNDLFGLQIGADTILWSNGRRFRIESAIKAGVYGNSAGSSLLLGDPSGGGGFAATNSRGHAAFVGDLNFTGVYQLSDRWAVRGGYQLLWLSGVAVASEQLKDVNVLAGDLNTNVTHGAFFHGATVGIERSW